MIYTHADCTHNELLALKNRHHAPYPVPVAASMVIARKASRALYNCVVFECGVEKTKIVSASVIVSGYSCSKRKLFQRAADSLRELPLTSYDARVRMFLKDEKYSCSTLTSEPATYDGNTYEVKVPRGIQYRNKRYCLSLARYLKPIEELTWGAKDRTQTAIFAKSRNSHQRGADIYAKFCAFDQPLVLCLDHSRYDSHCHKELLKLEHKYYQMYNNAPLFRWLLKSQLLNKGSTKNGTKYFVPATRMSGDMNTGLGNNVGNYCMMMAWLEESDVDGLVYLDGDDSVIFIENRDYHKLIDPAVYFQRLGHETRYAQVVNTMEQIEFCQSRPMFDGLSWRFVRNPFRVLARVSWTTRVLAPRFVPRYVKSIGQCELACGNGVPVMQAMATAIIAAGHGKYWSLIDNHYRAKSERFGPLTAKPFPITEQSRASFALSWGIGVPQQLKLEKQMSRIRLGETRQKDFAKFCNFTPVFAPM